MSSPVTPPTATSTVTITVSPMRRRHLPDVLAIEAQVYPRPWSSRLFENELERSGRVYLVARIGAQVVGYSGVLMIADDGHVATIAVDPAWQRRGIARCLLAELVRQAMVLGANQLTLEVRASNRGAQELYRSFGFAPAGARKAYYADNGEDALVMWAHDVRTDDYERRLRALESVAPGPVVRQGFSPAADSDPVHPASAAATADLEVS